MLLLDEPLSNLDAKLRVEMRGEIRQLQKTLGITALYVTHDQEEALAMSDRIAVMRAGKRRAGREPQDIYEQPATPFVAELHRHHQPAAAALSRGRDGEALRIGGVGHSGVPAAVVRRGERTSSSRCGPKRIRLLDPGEARAARLGDVDRRARRRSSISARITRFELQIGDGAMLHVDVARAAAS